MCVATGTEGPPLKRYQGPCVLDVPIDEDVEPLEGDEEGDGDAPGVDAEDEDVTDPTPEPV